MENINTISKVLSHPILLLVTGAIISSLIIPYYTKSWQDYQKELEIKSEIARSIGTNIADYIISGRLVQMPSFMKEIDVTQTAINWEVSISDIKSQIQSYFNDPRISEEWEKLTFAIREFVSLETGLSENWNDYDHRLCVRIKHIMNTYEYLSSTNINFSNNNPLNINITDFNKCKYIYDKEYPFLFIINPGKINWNILAHKELLLNDENKQREYLSSWLELERIFENEKNRYINTILQTPIFLT